MSKDVVTCADVVKFYSPKDEAEEYRKEDNQNQPFICVAKAVNEVIESAEDIKDFEEFASRIKLNDKGVITYVKSGNLDSAIMRTDNIEDIQYYNYNVYVRAKIEGRDYFVNAKADDYVFAWLLVHSKKNDWQTVSLYEEKKGEQEDFYEWFFERCEKKNGSYIPGQKWHLFQYILYQEMNSKYGFSTNVKRVNDIDKEKFTYYQYARCPELILWMAEEAGCKKIEEAKIKAKEMKEKKEGYQKICEELKKKFIPWAELEEKIPAKDGK